MIVIINKKQNINKNETVHRYVEVKGEKYKLVVKKDQRCIFKIIVYRRHLTCTKTTLAY